MLPNVPQFVVAFFGALRAGAVVVPVNPLYTPHELEHQLADAGAEVLVTLDLLFPRGQAALPATSIRRVLLTGIGAALPRHLRPLYALRQWHRTGPRVPFGGIVSPFQDMLAAEPLDTPVGTGPKDLAVLQYTGGTTGASKGAMLSHRNLLANALQARAWQGVTSQRPASILCAAPFFHVYGLTVAMNFAVVTGSTMLLLPRFIPADVARVAKRYRPQFFPGVPTMYSALANLPGFSAEQFGSLQACISGASALPAEVQRRFGEVSGSRLVEGYGLTEAGPVTHCNPIVGGCRPGTIGVPFPDTDAAITDPDTWEPVPLGRIGELTVHGPQVMMGYWNRPDETAAVLRNGWLHTGDLATMDADGYFTIVDRKKDLIIASGYNVYPREVEEVLFHHPKVQEAAVVGVPCDYRMETVKAVVVLKPGLNATEDEIVSFCRKELAAYKVPKIVEFRTDLPRTLVGKVLRRELREESTAHETDPEMKKARAV
jgi:long-chain acyl-CoA synthetase